MGRLKAPESKSKAIAVAPLTNTDVSPFEELPAELRVKVFEELFLRRGIRIYQDFVTGDHHGKTRADTVVVDDNIGEIVMRGFLARNNTSVLRVNRKIYNEAMDVLYAKNAFKIVGPETLRPFSRAAKTGFKLIRKLMILGIYSSPRLSYLWTFEGLRELTFTVDRWDQLGVAKQVARLVRGGATMAAQDEMWNKIRFVANGSWEADKNYRYPRAGWSSADAPVKVKEEVARRLAQPIRQSSRLLTTS